MQVRVLPPLLVVKPLTYTFVTSDGRWLGSQALRPGRRRVWTIGDEIVTEGPPNRYTTWRAVNVEGLRVTFAPLGERPKF